MVLSRARTASSNHERTHAMFETPFTIVGTIVTDPIHRSVGDSGAVQVPGGEQLAATQRRGRVGAGQLVVRHRELLGTPRGRGGGVVGEGRPGDRGRPGLHQRVRRQRRQSVGPRSRCVRRRSDPISRGASCASIGRKQQAGSAIAEEDGARDDAGQDVDRETDDEMAETEDAATDGIAPRCLRRLADAATPRMVREQYSDHERQHSRHGRIHLHDAEGPQGARRQGDP